MAAKLSVVSKKVKAPFETIHIDLNDKVQREAFILQIRAQTMHAVSHMLQDKGDPMSLMAMIPLSMIGEQMHNAAWEATYDCYPSLNPKGGKYVMDSETFTIEERGEKND